MINAEALTRLIADGESDRLEFTESLSDSRKFCEAICAFSNDLSGHGAPGYLVVGISDAGAPTGVAITNELLVNLASHRDNGQIIPQPVMNVGRLELNGVAVAVVEVFPATAPPVRFKGVTHIRVGPRRALATPDEERRLAERRISAAQTWDMRPCPEANLGDLAIDLFTLNYLPQAVSPEVLAENQRSIKEQMAALRMLDLRSDQPTNAGVVLFAKDCLRFFPGAYVQYVRYDGSTQGDDVHSDLRISGDLLSVLRELDRLAARLSDARPIRQPDLRDVTAYSYPPIALHELFMNAVIHRNYEGSTTPVAINEFDDRIEIHNPGSLYGDLTRERFPAGTSYRNPVLAEAAKTLGFVNRFGRGVALAQAQMARNGSPPIEFDIGENHMAAIVRVRP